MTNYPAGVKAQYKAVPVHVMDEDYSKLLQDVRQKIKKVIAARGYEVRDDIDAVIDRVTELQDLESDLQRLDFILDRLQDYKPKEASLLRLIYVEGLDLAEIADKLQVTEKTITRRRAVAEDSYIKLAR
jgi:DNA-directed RNA polymerase specialized sigma24 family protein